MRSLRLRLPLPIRRPWLSWKKSFLYIHHTNIFSHFVHIEGTTFIDRCIVILILDPNFTQPCCNTHSMTGVM